MTVSKKEKNKVIEAFLNKFGNILRSYESIIKDGGELKEEVKNQFSLTDYEFLSKLIDMILSEKVVIFGEKIDVCLNEDGCGDYYYLYYEIQRVINIYLCKMARFNFDLLLELMINNGKTIDFLCRRMRLERTVKMDDYLQEALLNYDGSVALDIFITRSFKESLKKEALVKKEKEAKKEEKEDNLQSEVQMENGEVKHEDDNKDEISKDSNIGISDTCNTESKEEPELSTYDKFVVSVNTLSSQNGLDSFVKFFKVLKMENCIEISANSDYDKYVLLRFGFINNNYFDIEEIANILGVIEKNILEYEKITALLMKEYVNNRIDGYKKLVMNLVY